MKKEELVNELSNHTDDLVIMMMKNIKGEEGLCFDKPEDLEIDYDYVEYNTYNIYYCYKGSDKLINQLNQVIEYYKNK
jgi:hypothetical protein